MLKTNVIGRLGADAEVKQANGREFITFRVYSQDKYTGGDGVTHDNGTWVDCTINGRPAVLPYLKRGTQVYISGNARLRIYSSAKERRMMPGLSVAVQSLELLGGNNDLVPSRLYDEQGVQHDVKKAYYSDVKKTTLLSQRGEQYAVDKNGWITPITPEPQTEEYGNGKNAKTF